MRVAISQSGANSGFQVYFPFGSPRAGNLPTDCGFTGQKLDASDGLMYYNARYYDTALGRFISADTIVPSAANPQSLNRYAYVLNNPVRLTDPSGNCADDGSGQCERDDSGHIIVRPPEPPQPPTDTTNGVDPSTQQWSSSSNSCETTRCYKPGPVDWCETTGCIKSDPDSLFALLSRYQPTGISMGANINGSISGAPVIRGSMGFTSGIDMFVSNTVFGTAGHQNGTYINTGGGVGLGIGVAVAITVGVVLNANPSVPQSDDAVSYNVTVATPWGGLTVTDTTPAGNYPLKPDVAHEISIGPAFGAKLSAGYDLVHQWKIW